MKVVNHKLEIATGQPVRFEPTDNHGGEIRPIYIVMHYTASTSLPGTIDWFKRRQANASAHIVIGVDGEVVQMVPLNRRAWHAGESKWGELVGLNAYSIGIEIVNAGKLRKRADGAWITWSKQAISEDQVTVARHKNEASETGWHEYTEAQIRAAIDVGNAIAQHYPIVDVLGHDDIAPTRKVDPGPLFPMGSVRSRILGREH
jgi:N-acetylmuramoyl-L-alanine amidase